MLWKKNGKPAAAPKGSDLSAYIDEASEIEGKYTFAGTVMVNGEVTGNILASERVELRGTARVFGDVEAPVIVVEEGVLFEGHCRMTKSRPSDQPAAVTPQ